MANNPEVTPCPVFEQFYKLGRGNPYTKVSDLCFRRCPHFTENLDREKGLRERDPGVMSNTMMEDALYWNGPESMFPGCRHLR